MHPCMCVEAGMKFSDVVLDAKAKGYTEPDPRDDLSGTDVARKVSGAELHQLPLPVAQEMTASTKYVQVTYLYVARKVSRATVAGWLAGWTTPALCLSGGRKGAGAGFKP